MNGAERLALDERTQEVLRIVVHEHVRTSEPVSSRLVAKLHPEKLSPATIRNLMADLTDQGYLEQPHTSAGRLPTDKGYRYFVDEILAGARRLPTGESRRIRELLLSSRKLDELLARAGRLLATMTHHVGVVLAPDLEKTVLEHVDFVRIGPGRIVAIFVSGTGLVTHRVIDTDDDIAQDELDRVAARIKDQFGGLTLGEARRAIIDMLRTDEQMARALGRKAAGSVIHLLDAPFPEESGELILEGTSSLLDAPEFGDIARLREALRVLEERTRLATLLDRCLAGPGLSVIIGAETNDPQLSLMAVIASPYRAGNLTKGLVGVVGPRRMEYARTVAIVDHLARTISEILAAGEKEPEDA